MSIPWKKYPDKFPEGEECIALYEVWPVGSCYVPVNEFDRGVKKWITLKELNHYYGLTDWTAEDHCKALN